MSSPYIEVVFNLPLNSAFSYTLPGGQQAEEGMIGCRVYAPFGRRKLEGWIISLAESLPPGVGEAKPVYRVLDGYPLFDAPYLDLARWVSSFYLCSLGEALAVMLPGGKRETALPGLGFGAEGPQQKITELTEEQKEALEAICKNPGGRFYLYGITGSGKTEVFLQAAERVLAEGRGVLFLVPEIGLTHQLVDDLKGRFSLPPAVLHSQLTPSQKLKEWRRIQSGQAPFVLGARSAIFAPLPQLGLIIIDEEQDNSYKSGSTPRYHSRQVAMRRCHTGGATLLMGSATPSAEAWQGMRQGVFDPLKLRQRPAGGTLPKIEVVDLKKAKSLLSQPLIKRMGRVLEEGKQTILFLNRRGHSYYFHCLSCGYEMTCRQCSVSLTFHKSPGRMICHYCGYQQAPLNLCPECRSLDVGYAGFGTEQVEEQVRALFPEARVERIDTDRTRKKGSLQDILGRFRGGSIDILLGTQMVAKGLNFPGVKLVGIILADTGLGLPDFRSQERTFSLIQQVAGRAGRYRKDGEVLLQTFRPDNPAIVYGCSGDMENFYAQELAQRQELGFPPFGRLIRVVYRGKGKEKVCQMMIQLVQNFQAAGLPEVLGPAECPLGLVAGNYRWHCLINCGRDFTAIHRVVASVLAHQDLPPGVYREVDVDPLQVL